MSDVKVLVVAPLPPPVGGIARWTSLILEQSRVEPGADVRVLNTAVRFRSIRDVRTLNRIFSGALNAASIFLRYSVVLYCWRPNVIHITTAGSYGLLRDMVVASLGRALGKYIILHVRMGRTQDIMRSRGLEWLLYKITIKLTHVVVVLDRGSESAIRKTFQRKMVLTIPNPAERLINYSRVKQGGGEVNTILFVGWVVREKGVEELLRSWESVRRPHWRLAIIGPCESTYKKYLLSSFNLDQCEFLGEKRSDDVMKYLKNAEVFVLPSHTEGFPNAVVEAMFFGLPIVSTSVGAIPDMLSDQCGLLVSPGDHESLADALLSLMEDSSLREKLGRNARARAEQEYDLQLVYKRYLALWNRADQQTLLG